MWNINKVRNIKLKLSIMFSMLFMILSIQSAVAAIALDRTRIVFNAEQPVFSLTISNKNSSLPYLAQGWIEDAEGEKIRGPLVVIPPLQRLEANQKSQIKIQALATAKQLPSDRESLYYFNLREIPPKSDKPNTLQIALQTRIKLFYRPEALAVMSDAAAWQEQITLQKKGDQYVVKNPTGYFVVIVDGSTAKDLEGPEDFEPLMLAPFSEDVLNISATRLGNQPVLTYVNDYGARPQLSFRCEANQCQVIRDKKSN